MIKVLVNGAFGKMGALACDAISNNKNLVLIAKAGRHDSLVDVIKNHKPDVVLELTNAEVVFENCRTIIDCDVKPVIGASGLNFNQISDLLSLASKKQLGGLIVPNFSLSAALLIKYAQDASKYFNGIEIIEKHHPDKLDFPSGTAKYTAEKIAENRPGSTIKQSRGTIHNGIPIHSIRLPGILANQEVIFGNFFETLTIMQNTTDRQAFMPGIIMAIEKVVSLNKMFYGLENII